MSGELAGRLSELVTVQRRGAERDSLGGAAGAWAAIGDLWAGFEVRPGGPQVAGDTLDAEPRWRVTVRAGSGVMVGDRLAWRGRMLRVDAVLDDPALPDRTTIEAEELR